MTCAKDNERVELSHHPPQSSEPQNTLLWWDANHRIRQLCVEGNGDVVKDLTCYYSLLWLPCDPKASSWFNYSVGNMTAFFICHFIPSSHLYMNQRMRRVLGSPLTCQIIESWSYPKPRAFLPQERFGTQDTRMQDNFRQLQQLRLLMDWLQSRKSLFRVKKQAGKKHR